MLEQVEGGVFVVFEVEFGIVRFEGAVFAETSLFFGCALIDNHRGIVLRLCRGVFGGCDLHLDGGIIGGRVMGLVGNVGKFDGRGCLHEGLVGIVDVFFSVVFVRVCVFGVDSFAHFPCHHLAVRIGVMPVVSAYTEYFANDSYGFFGQVYEVGYQRDYEYEVNAYVAKLVAEKIALGLSDGTAKIDESALGEYGLYACCHEYRRPYHEYGTVEEPFP